MRTIPWIEVNSTDHKYLRKAVVGLPIWQTVTDTVIISTVPGKAALYDRLSRRLPGVHIIPGIKTSPVLGPKPFDSPRGWRRIADAVREVCAVTGERRCVIENETALQAYRHGEYRIDHKPLLACLQQMPDDIELWWYPAIPGYKEPEQLRLKSVCDAVQRACKVRFTGISDSYPRHPDYPPSLRSKEMLRLAAEPLIPLVYVGGKYWPYERAPEVLKPVKTDGVVFYPGARNWVEAARSISRALRASR